jgi:hypothetical protein
LRRKLSKASKDIRDLTQRSISYRDSGDTVVRITNRLPRDTGLRPQGLSDGETGGVVSAGCHPVPRAELVERIAQLPARGI